MQKQRMCIYTLNKKETIMQNTNTCQPIFDMLDLFYANKHMYERLKNRNTKPYKRNERKIGIQTCLSVLKD